MTVFLGVDVGTSSTKGVLVDATGAVIASAVREHDVSNPRPGWFEMPMDVWWREFVSIARGLTAGRDVAAVGVSGMGPCVGIADEHGAPLRDAILYGVDTRAVAQIAELTARYGDEAIRAAGGNSLSTQSAGPKLRWIAEEEPEAFARARMLFMPASRLAYQLTGEYVLDHQSASQSSPLYDRRSGGWHDTWAAELAGPIGLPRLVWADERVGVVTPDAAAQTGLPAGIPVVAGTIDAWTEAVSVGATRPGDLMLMYGTTMFLVHATDGPVGEDRGALWLTAGAFAGTESLAAGMATSGAITSWLQHLVGGVDYTQLTAEAADSPPGANGLLMLPYFAGERTPIADPDARGAILGLTTRHTRGDLYRAALEATALGVRHNVEAMRAAGSDIRRVVGVGGGTQGGLWTRIVSDVTGLEQDVPTVTVGASYGAAYLAARAIDPAVDIDAWNPPRERVTPRGDEHTGYAELYELYREAYPATVSIAHRLAERQRSAG